LLSRVSCLDATSLNEISSLSLHDALPILSTGDRVIDAATLKQYLPQESNLPALLPSTGAEKESISERDILYKVLFDMKRDMVDLDRKSTRLNSSHVKISYAVFCLKKKKKT